MKRICRESEPMCETSEPGERLIEREDILPISLNIGRRILEIFGYQSIANIVFRLRSTRREIDDVVNGETLPTAELLLGIKKATGASIDWILTGEGPKFITPTARPSAESRPEQNLALAVIATHRDRDSSLISTDPRFVNGHTASSQQTATRL
ncbi:MAG TPA: hypothetical protein PLP21_12975 [Pyrinomonadaceae bacterium]|nr:hypothetical protein [Acidobacteriota bacterium]HQZ97227.1 hypothetical protein [Pyrinomonadaceae bacterium]